MTRSSPGYTLTLDNMNHGAPPSPACKASSFTDDFSTGSFDGAAWARNYITAGSTLTEHDGIAELHSAER